MSEKKWSTSNYRSKRTQKLEKQAPQWVTVPSGAEFLLRKVGMMAYAIAGQMPRSLSSEAVEAWEEQGIDSGEPQTKVVTNERIEEGQRNVVLMARIVQQACVLPKLTPNPQSDDEMDPAELDDDDVLFIVRYATGQLGTVNLQGGQVMHMADLKSVPKKPGRRIRTGTDS